MPWSLSTLATTALSLGLGLLVVVRALGWKRLKVTGDWLAELATDHYRPMLRLLDENDFRFLRTQRGFRPEMEKRLRKQRIRVFRTYLRMLDADFQRVCDGLKRVRVEAGRDGPGLASILVRREVAFSWGMIVVRFRLALYRYGMSRVDVAALVGMFDGLRVELSTMTRGAEHAAQHAAA